MKPRYFSYLLAFIAQPALADECTAKIAAMFQDGPLDAYQRPAHRHEKQVSDADGNVTYTFLSIVETPLRTISGIKGGDMTLAIDDDTWNGPSPDGLGRLRKTTCPRTASLGTLPCRRNRQRT